MTDALQRSVRERTRGCERPIRLVGSTTTVDPATGEVVGSYWSADEADGITWVRCGDRRAWRCESCSHEYKGDAWHLLSAGLAGGKGVPEWVAGHPTLFVTLTAPGFGLVHGIRQKGPCRGRRERPFCIHGRPQWCKHHHTPDDARLGEPLCGDCYDYPAHVVWQWWAPELWRRTTINLSRYLADALGVARRTLRDHARISYSKVAEFQARGVIHFHVLVRLDGPDGPATTPPDMDTDRFGAVVADAIRATTLARQPTPRHDAYRLRWGAQLDIRPVSIDADRDSPSGPIHPEAAAGYLAKYLTKSTEDFGIRGRIRCLEDLELLGLRDHVRRIILQAHQLSLAGGPYRPLRDRYATLGYRGHPITKTRRYSTTFGALRRARRIWRQRPPGLDPDATIRDLPDDWDDPDDNGLIVLKDWTYTGIGHPTAPARLAVVSAVHARIR